MADIKLEDVGDAADGGLLLPPGMWDEETEDVVVMLEPKDWPWEVVMDEMCDCPRAGNILDFAKNWAHRQHTTHPMLASYPRAKVLTLCYIMASKNCIRGARNAV
jgi:hypothetical protein